MQRNKVLYNLECTYAKGKPLFEWWLPFRICELCLSVCGFDSFDTVLHGFSPVGDFNIKYFLDFCLVENRVGRTCDRRGELTAVARVDAACCVSCNLCNFNSKVIP